jgi:hypothetical protein
LPERVVKTTLIIDEHGAVRAVKAVSTEASHTERGLTKLDKSVKGLGSSFKGLKGILAGGAGLLGVGGLAFGLESIVSKTKEVATETEKFSSISGLGATSSLRLNAALKARGVSTESVGKAIFKLGKNIETAEAQERKFGHAQLKAMGKGKELTAELGAQAKAFQKLGIRASEFRKLTEEQKLELLITRLSRMKDGTEKNAIAQALFSKGAAALVPVLKQGSLGLEHQIELTKKFYPTLKEGSGGLRELNEKSAESKMAFEGFEFTLGTLLIPTITKLMASFSQMIAEVEHGKGPLEGIRKAIEGIAKFGANAAGFIKGIASDLGIKLSGNTLGAVLAAAAAAHVATKIPGVKATKTLGKALGKYAVPALATPFGQGAIVGGAIPFATAKGVQLGAEAISPGYLKSHTLAEAERILTGRNYHPGGGGRTELGGRAAPLNLSDVHGAVGPIHVHVKIGTKEIAEAIVADPYANRRIAEGTTHYSLKRNARG